ncbi:efflux RND transporter periplasmic adaptor subunit [Salinispirillum marinum]|uniref:Efflux RND transporter periplasmic adaptor subunit n=2 Tax=Saccharospirillaceae TaxID=255527 RepID=A0ABV8BHW7_9GAMM
MKRYLGQAAAIVIMVLLTVWMYSGPDDAETAQPTRETTVSTSLPKVQIQRVEAETVQRILEVSAQTQANRSVEIRAQASGEVLELNYRRGDTVSAGTVIARLDAGELPERLISAQALEQQRRIELDGVRTLVNRGLQNATNLAAAETAYADAIANRRSLELQLEHTEIKAPFSGVLESLAIELGSYIQVGSSIALLNDFSPLIVSAQVSENDLGNLIVGQRADIELVTGERLNGEIRFISSQARQATRTFTVEIAIASQVLTPSAGLTAKVLFPLAERRAHFISPALLSLDQAGNLSLKVLAADQTVTQARVEIVKSSTDGVWVGGLNEPADIITVGQGFVSAGDRVDAIQTEQ